MKTPFRTLLLAALVAAGNAHAAATEPFNGKDLEGWKPKGAQASSHWTVGTATLNAKDPKQLSVAASGHELINGTGHGVDLYTVEKFGDARFEIEVMIPQGSNSGIYLMGEYEVQVFDSHGKTKLGGGDMGAIYSAAVPSINACKAPGEWQKYVIEFKAPRFDSTGKKTANARFASVTLNGQQIHKDVEMKGPTPGGLTGKEAAVGPLLFQGDHGAVAYRNIRVSPM